MNNPIKQHHTKEYITVAVLFLVGFIYYVVVSPAVPQSEPHVLGISTDVDRYSTQYPVQISDEFAVIETNAGQHMQIFYRGFHVDPSDSQVMLR